MENLERGSVAEDEERRGEGGEERAVGGEDGERAGVERGEVHVESLNIIPCPEDTCRAGNKV